MMVMTMKLLMVMLYEVLKGMYEHRACKWDETMKSGNILPLFKKGDRRDKNNYRGICLLPFTSRVLAKIKAEISELG